LPARWFAGLSGLRSARCRLDLALHLSPLQTATLIIALGADRAGLLGLEAGRALDFGKLWPFVLGAAIGVPVGVGVLTWANPVHVRMGVGVFLVLSSLYAYFRPSIPSVAGGGVGRDAGVGFPQRVLGGIIGSPEFW